MCSNNDAALLSDEALIQEQFATISSLIDENRDLKCLLEQQTDLSRGYLQQCNVFEQQRRAAVEQNAILRSSLLRLSNSARESVLLRTSARIENDDAGTAVRDESAAQRSSSELSSAVSVPEDVVAPSDADEEGLGGTITQSHEHDNNSDKQAHMDIYTQNNDDTVSVAAPRPSKRSRTDALAGATASPSDHQPGEADEQIEPTETKRKRPAIERLRDRVLNKPGWGLEALQHAFFAEQQYKAEEWSDMKRTTLITLINNYESNFQDVLTAMSRHMLIRIVKGPHFEPWITSADVRAVAEVLAEGKTVGKKPITDNEMGNAQKALRTRNTSQYFNESVKIAFDSHSGCVRFYTSDSRSGQLQPYLMAERNRPGKDGQTLSRSASRPAASRSCSDAGTGALRRSTRGSRAGARSYHSIESSDYDEE